MAFQRMGSGSSGGTSEVKLTLYGWANAALEAGINPDLVKNATTCAISGNADLVSNSISTNGTFIQFYKFTGGTKYFLTASNTWTTSESFIYIVNSGTITPGSTFATVDLSSFTEIANADYLIVYCGSSSATAMGVDFTFS